MRERGDMAADTFSTFCLACSDGDQFHVRDIGSWRARKDASEAFSMPRGSGPHRGPFHSPPLARHSLPHRSSNRRMILTPILIRASVGPPFVSQCRRGVCLYRRIVDRMYARLTSPRHWYSEPARRSSQSTGTTDARWAGLAGRSPETYQGAIAPTFHTS